MRTLELTKAEADYLLKVCFKNSDNGENWSRDDQFMCRQERVVKKIEAAINS